MSSSNDASKGVNEMFEQAARMYQSALEAGIKIQEQSVKSFTDMMSGLASPQQWQQRAQSTMEEALAAGKQNVDESIKVMNENSKASIELLQKAFDARVGKSPEDIQEKTREMWETAMGSLRRNTEVMVQANTRLLDSWRQLTNMVENGEPPKEA